MATHPTTVRNGIVNFVVDQLDAGSTNATPRAVFQTAGDVEVGTLNMDGAAAFGASAAGVATAAAIADGLNSTGGTTTKCIFTDKDNNEVFQATVGINGAEINLSTNVVPPNATMRLTALTYQGPS
jgi:hypothetical protein